jgi:hypothetical protein
MVSDRLKKFIFDKLYKELSHLEIIPYDNSLFFIDRKEKYWYLELENNGTLYWRVGFFSEFFLPFSIESPVYVKIISDWVEEVLNHKVSTTNYLLKKRQSLVEEVLNHKVSTTTNVDGTYFLKVEEVLNHKVSTTYLLHHAIHAQVEEVLNHKVSTTRWSFGLTNFQAEEVLNHKVSITYQTELDKCNQVERVLNQN